MTSQAQLSPTQRLDSRGAIIWTSIVSLALLAIWAGFWLWFSISVVVSEGTLAWQPYTFIAAIIALALTAWRYPKVGGPLMIAAGLAAAFYYNNIWARTMLALPAIAIGALRIIAAYRAAVHITHRSPLQS